MGRADERPAEPEQKEKGAAVRFPPPLVYLLSILLGVGLQKMMPLPFPIDRGPLAFAVAALPFVLGVYFLAASLGWFLRTGQNPEPWKPSPELIAEGIYRWTRNPMYLGMAWIQLSVGIVLGNAWVILGIPLSMIGVFIIAIRPEETYLESKFGEDYRRYKSSVNRWLGRRSS